MPKQVLILGGGISGLTAGIYAQKMGFQSEIYEKHSIPGGECTGWDRKGFHIDGCVHWLTGSKEGSELGRIWRETGGLHADVPIHQPESFCTAQHAGVTVTLYSDMERLRGHLTEISPGDKKEIDLLCNAILSIKDSGIPVTPPDMMNPMDLFRLMRRMSGSMKVMKQFKLPLSEYAQRFQHPAIRQALTSFLPANNSAYILPYNLGVIASGNGGRPAGGSRALALRMAETYTSLGGKLQLGKEVQSVEIQHGKAAGAKLADGILVPADYMIPAMDIHITLDRLLDGSYPNPKIKARDNDPSAYPAVTCAYAAFGIDADLSSVPADLSFSVSPYLFEDKERSLISFRHYCYEPSFAPQGKSVGVINLYADYAWWKNKHNHPAAYQHEKKRLLEVLCAALEEHFPELKRKIVPLDLATPITYERYCGAWHGAWMPYGTTAHSKQMIQDGRIKGIDNLFMAGQWLMPPGGLTIAMLTGKWAIQRLCKQEKLPWRW